MKKVPDVFVSSLADLGTQLELNNKKPIQKILTKRLN